MFPAIQSVLCGADALARTRTGAVGSASFKLHENGTLEYKVERNFWWNLPGG